MQFKAVILSAMISSIFLAGCSVQPNGEDVSEEEQGLFERKNIAPDPADNTQSPRKAEHAFARIALSCINRQYPNKISHVMASAEDVAEPVKLTPVFLWVF